MIIINELLDIYFSILRINQFSYIQRRILENSSKRPIHDLLRRVKEIKKLTEKAISNGALVGDRTSQYNMKNSTNIEIKVMKIHEAFFLFTHGLVFSKLTNCMMFVCQLLTKVVRDLEKERGDTENILQDKRKIEEGYHLQEKCQCIGEKQDADRKEIHTRFEESF